jgi:hypothetical protein
VKLTDFRTKPPGKVGVKAKNEIEIDFDVGLALRGVTIDPPNAANLRACEFTPPSRWSIELMTLPRGK